MSCTFRSFADVVLRILSETEEWSSDTIEEIAYQAELHGLGEHSGGETFTLTDLAKRFQGDS